MKNKLTEHLKNKIVRWNNNFPLDYWWRNKYKIPYGSEAHKEMSFIDMYFEYLEDKMLKELSEKKNEQNISKVSQKEIDQDFDNLDLSKY